MNMMKLRIQFFIVKTNVPSKPRMQVNMHSEQQMGCFGQPAGAAMFEKCPTTETKFIIFPNYYKLKQLKCAGVRQPLRGVGRVQLRGNIRQK
jgi:hypothetical protein